MPMFTGGGINFVLVAPVVDPWPQLLMEKSRPGPCSFLHSTEDGCGKHAEDSAHDDQDTERGRRKRGCKRRPPQKQSGHSATGGSTLMLVIRSEQRCYPSTDVSCVCSAEEWIKVKSKGPRGALSQECRHTRRGGHRCGLIVQCLKILFPDMAPSPT